MGEKDEAKEDVEGHMPKQRISPEGTEEENAEGNMPRSRGISPEGTEEENAEGNMPKSRGISPEGTEEENAEGQRMGRVSADDSEDDTEGHAKRR